MHILVTILIFILIPNSYAHEGQANKLNRCVPSKVILNNYEPAIFHTSNNLLRHTGEQALYCGRKILLNLELVDKDCVPISDAKIYLWQVGCDGKYPYQPLRTQLPSSLFNPHSGSTFLGSGTASTNNNGIAEFITILPPSIGKERPHINIRVYHRDLGSLQTKIYVNSSELIEQGEYDIVSKKITMPVQNKYRYY